MSKHRRSVNEMHEAMFRGDDVKCRQVGICLWQASVVIEGGGVQTATGRSWDEAIEVLYSTHYAAPDLYEYNPLKPRMYSRFYAKHKAA